jgi:4-hydroxybenzoate polyprenyltransferase
LRPHQWVKNLLVALPLLASHRIGETNLIWATLATFGVFCLIASGNYILNDLFDVESDRQHPTKRGRPIASGAVTVPKAVLMATMLLGSGIFAAGMVGRDLLLVMLVYLLLANLYSFQLKRRLLVDVLALAAMYTLRPVAGGVATDIIPSTWLLAFCMFFFACLAFAKRYTELRHRIEKDAHLPGRAYEAADLDILRTVGPINGYLAVMVIALYISSDAVTTTKLYPRPQALWLICPVLAYWITRLWFFAHRGKLDDDPVAFALKDWKTWLAVIVCGLIALAATIRF